MARCLGTMHWPCDHAEKHSRAALLGWLRRRGQIGRSRADRTALDDLGIHRAHTDASHKGLVRFQEKKSSKWQEMPKKSFDALMRAAKADRREKRSEARQHDLDERMAHAEFLAHKN